VQEQSKFLGDDRHVLKLNDAIYYNHSWIDYLNNVLLHNYYFPDTAYELIRNHDCRHSQLGIIVEDLHDENVWTKDGTLNFIDTVFFLTDAFYAA
jgi:hypothetical protein